MKPGWLQRTVMAVKRQLTDPKFSFTYTIVVLSLLCSLAYVSVGAVSAPAVARVNAALKPCINFLGHVGLGIRNPPMTGTLPKDAYVVMTGIQIWAAAAYALAVITRIAWTRRPFSGSRAETITRLMAERKLSRARAQVAFHLYYAPLAVLAVIFTWCLLNGLNSDLPFHVDSYGVLLLPALVFVLPGMLAFPFWLALFENVARDIWAVVRLLTRNDA